MGNLTKDYLSKLKFKDCKMPFVNTNTASDTVLNVCHTAKVNGKIYGVSSNKQKSLGFSPKAPRRKGNIHKFLPVNLSVCWRAKEVGFVRF